MALNSNIENEWQTISERGEYEGQKGRKKKKRRERHIKRGTESRCHPLHVWLGELPAPRYSRLSCVLGIGVWRGKEVPSVQSSHGV